MKSTSQHGHQCAGGGAWEWDLKNHLLTWGEKEIALHGIEPDTFEQVFARQGEMVHPDDLQRLRSSLREAIDSRRGIGLDYRVLTPSGDVKTHTLICKTILGPDEEPVRLVGGVVDITACRDLENQLAECEQRFRTVADSSPFFIWLSEANGERSFVNQWWSEFTGLPAEDAMGTGWMKAVHPEDRREWLDAYQTAAVDSSSFSVQYRLRRHDGQYIWHAETATPRSLEDGDAGGYAGSALDVSEQMAAADEKKRLLERMQEADLRQRGFLREVLASLTEGRLQICDTAADLPAPMALEGEPIVLCAQDLRQLRVRVQEVAVRQKYSNDRWEDLVTAAGEAAMNAVVHAGGGTAEIRSNDDGCIQVWIKDDGRGIAVERLHRATLERGYTTAGSWGHGFWMMIKTADNIWLLTGPAGTTVVLQQERVLRDPPWMRHP